MLGVVKPYAKPLLMSVPANIITSKLKLSLTDFNMPDHIPQSNAYLRFLDDCIFRQNRSVTLINAHQLLSGLHSSLELSLPSCQLSICENKPIETTICLSTPFRRAFATLTA